MPFIATDAGQRNLCPLFCMTWVTDTRFGRAVYGAMPLDLEAMLLAADDRLSQARDVADACRDRGEIHMLLMRSVFLMEDIVFMLHQMAALEDDPKQDHAG